MAFCTGLHEAYFLDLPCWLSPGGCCAQEGNMRDCFGLAPAPGLILL